MIRRLSMAAALLAAAPPVVAQTPAVNTARAAGAVGERFDGYLGIAAPAGPAVRNQVATINIQRRSLYTRLAASKGVSPQDVGITAGCTLLARVAAGEVYLGVDSKWRKRLPGQPPPVPDYCR